MGSPPLELATIVQLREEINAALQRYVRHAAEAVVKLHPMASVLAEELETFVMGRGKRLRPTLVLAGYLAADGDDPRQAMGPAIAIELLHSCALIHDDVIDEALIRRGQPSTQVRFADRRQRDAQHYGRGAALLLGDLAFVEADRAFFDATLPPARLLAAFSVFTAMRMTMVVGEFLDHTATGAAPDSENLTEAIATYKSGHYSVSGPLQIGALLGGACNSFVDALGRFGSVLGTAFQLRDDLLGVFGDEAATGKSAATDLAAGKPTLLAAKALTRLSGADRARFLSLFGSPSLTTADLDGLRELIEASGARTAIETRIRADVAEALLILDEHTIPYHAKRSLTALADYLTHRIR